MQKLTRRDWLLAISISIVAGLGALAALTEQSPWAIVAVIVLLSVTGLLFVVRHRDSQRQWEKVVERLDRNDATGRSSRESLTRASERMNRLDQWADGLTSQLNEIREQNTGMAGEVRSVEGKVKDIKRDLYDLNLAVEDHHDALEATIRQMTDPATKNLETDR